MPTLTDPFSDTSGTLPESGRRPGAGGRDTGERRGGLRPNPPRDEVAGCGPNLPTEPPLAQQSRERRGNPAVGLLTVLVDGKDRGQAAAATAALDGVTLGERQERRTRRGVRCSLCLLSSFASFVVDDVFVSFEVPSSPCRHVAFVLLCVCWDCLAHESHDPGASCRFR